MANKKKLDGIDPELRKWAKEQGYDLSEELLVNWDQIAKDKYKFDQKNKMLTEGNTIAYDLAGEAMWEGGGIGVKDYSERGKWPIAPYFNFDETTDEPAPEVTTTEPDYGTPVETPSNSGGGGGGGTTTTTEPKMEMRPGPDGELLPFYYNDADLPYWQRTYDRARNMENLPQFQFDDTYAPDSEGYRDVGGYLLDMGKFVAGSFGASKELDRYEPSDDFKQMITESRNRRNLGLSQEARSEWQNRADRGYNYDVTNIRNMAGGSGGAALANLGGAATRYYDAQNQLTTLDEQLKQANRDQFYSAAMAGEEAHRFGWQEERQRDVMSKMAAGELMSDSMDNIIHRKEYEDTYLKPGSPYYEYKKELTLDTRMNRELKEFAEQDRIRRINQEMLGIQNQAQEEIEGIETGRRIAYDEWKKRAQEQGYNIGVNSADDFANYNGEPIVEFGAGNDPVTTQGVGATNDFIAPNAYDPSVEFGLSRKEMDDMSDADLAEKGIERTSYDQTFVDPNTGKERTETVYNYGISQPMDTLPGEPSETDQAYYNIEGDVDKEYAEKEKELLDNYYLQDEKKYNKMYKQLQEEKKAEIKRRREEYLKK